MRFIPFSVQFSHSVVPDSLQPHGLQHARLACPITDSQSLLKLMSIKSVMSSNHLVLCHPLHLLPSIFPSIRVFFNESILCIKLPKYWSFTFSSSLSNEHSGLISFRIDQFDLPVVQGTLKSRLQLSHPYMTTGKTIALSIWNFEYLEQCNLSAF